jgi:lysophospholipase L1-like esterase
LVLGAFSSFAYKQSPMKRAIAFSLSFVVATSFLSAATALIPPKPEDAYFAKFNPKPAPQPEGLLLKKGDRLAIIGDSITEQKMYSRVMETYLTVCVPDLEITARQYGWGGETAPGFLARMTNDCLRFNPTVATTCYGMNDHGYRAYEQQIGDRYRRAQTAIVRAFKDNGVRVVLGSPGCVSKKAEALNLNLCELRNIDIDIAAQEKVAFADVFWPMFTAGRAAQLRYATNYAIAGNDGVHPGWSGSFIMAYAFLRAFGLDGEIGTYTVDLGSGSAKASAGHEVVSAKNGEVTIKSARYPFCATGDVKSDNSIRSAMTLVPFNKELNRLMLVAKGGSAQKYKVTWGTNSKSYTAEQLAAGVNLAEDFVTNPFSSAFEKVDAAVLKKQVYETHQIKNIFHGAEFKLEPDTMVKLTERVRAPLAEAIKTAFVPVTHTIQIVAE